MLADHEAGVSWTVVDCDPAQPGRLARAVVVVVAVQQAG